jgi:uncharacterized membrane protein YgcG
MLDLDYKTKQATIQYYSRATKNSTLDPFFLLASSISLACKSTNTYRKQRDIINVIYYLTHQSEIELDEKYWRLKDTLVIYEDLVLRILDFNLDYKCLYFTLSNELVRRGSKELDVQVCFAILNDLLYLWDGETTVWLVAVFYLMHVFVGSRVELVMLIREFEGNGSASTSGHGNGSTSGNGSGNGSTSGSGKVNASGSGNGKVSASTIDANVITESEVMEVVKEYLAYCKIVLK